HAGLRLSIVSHVVSHSFRQQKLTGVATMHDALGHVDSAAGDVGAIIDVGDSANGTTMDTHSNAKLGPTFQRPADLQSAFDRSIRRGGKHQGHAVAGWNLDEFPLSFRSAERVGTANNI